jgi:hypothetical protein
MSRFSTTILTLVLVGLLPSVAWSQFVQPYPFGSGIPAGANTSQTAGANTAATAGPTPYLGAAGGQYYPQPNIGPPTGVSATVGRFYQAFGSVAPSYVISATPWFSNVTLRERLALNDLQYQNLYGAYVDAWTRYNQAIAQLPANMELAERMGRVQALEEAFNAELNTAAEANIPEPEMRQQFNRLNLQFQHQGSTTTGAMPSRVGLTDEQRRRLRLMAFQWNQMMAQLRERVATDQSVGEAEFNDLRRQAFVQIESTLRPDQFPYWASLTAEYYDLSAAAAPPQPAKSSGQESQPGESGQVSEGSGVSSAQE